MHKDYDLPPGLMREKDTREGEGARAAVYSARSVQQQWQQQQQQQQRGSCSVARLPLGRKKVAAERDRKKKVGQIRVVLRVPKFR